MRKPMVVGLLMLIAGTFNILWLVSVFARILDAKELLHTTWVITPFPLGHSRCGIWR